MCEAIILAAGYSKRAETNKMLLRINDKTILENCIETFYNACTKIIVVGGYNINDIKPIVEKYDKAILVYNLDFNQGMFSSVKEGLKYVTSNKFFLTPGDYPLIKEKTLQQMLQYHSDITIPAYNGQQGHPVLINKKYIHEIINGAYVNLREFVNAKKPTILMVNDIGVIKDIDTIEDYNELKEIFYGAHNNRSN